MNRAPPPGRNARYIWTLTPHWMASTSSAPTAKRNGRDVATSSTSRPYHYPQKDRFHFRNPTEFPPGFGGAPGNMAVLFLCVCSVTFIPCRKSASVGDRVNGKIRIRKAFPSPKIGHLVPKTDLIRACGPVPRRADAGNRSDSLRKRPETHGRNPWWTGNRVRKPPL